MKTGASIKNMDFSMKRLQVLPLLVGLFFAATAAMVSAQPAAPQAGATETRAQVKMERDEFIKSHQYDQATETWVLKPGYEAPAGMKARADIKAARDEFLRNARWDAVAGSWVPLKTPRDLSTMSRAEVRSETKNFARTHDWDATNDKWVETSARKGKGKKK